MTIKEIVNNETNLNMVVNRVAEQGETITESVRNLCAYIGIEYTDVLRRSFSRKLSSMGITDSPEKQPLEHSEEYKEALSRELPKSKYYLISSAQADTPIHEQFWQNMLAYADHIGAEVILQPSRYGAPTSLKASKRVTEREKNKSIWASEVRPYLYAKRLKLNSLCEVLCDVKVSPTAVTPISGLNGFTGMGSSILPHPKIQLKSLPVLDDYPSKLVLTTGSCTIPQYTDTKAGKKGEFHHQIGFAIVEIVDDKKYHVRQVQADDSGNFQDLWFRVYSGEVERLDITVQDHRSPFVVWGDLHIGQHDPESVEQAIDITCRLGCDNVILHDVFNGKSISHHEEKDPFVLLEKEEDGSDNLEEEIGYMLNYLSNLELNLGNTVKKHVVSSNHDLWLETFLKCSDWRKIRNKKKYLELANILASGVAKKGLVNHLIESNVGGYKTYGEGDSLRIKDYELAIHGHVGASASKGGINQFKNLNTKMVSAHTHSPERLDSAVIAGTLTKLRMGYNKGLSSWANGVVVCYPHGKVSHVHIFDNSYTTLK